jgi:hypothetical protein
MRVLKLELGDGGLANGCGQIPPLGLGHGIHHGGDIPTMSLLRVLVIERILCIAGVPLDLILGLGMAFAIAMTYQSCHYSVPHQAGGYAGLVILSEHLVPIRKI